MSQSEMCVSVWDWLCALRLEQYCDAFQDFGLLTLGQCQSLSLEQLESLGVTLPGHRRRILASLHKSQSPTHPPPHQQPDTQGSPRPRPNQAVAAEEVAAQQQGRGAALCPKPPQRERPVPVPPDRERPVPKERREVLPVPRERPRPTPRERAARSSERSGSEEGRGDSGEEGRTPRLQRDRPRARTVNEADGGPEEGRPKPVPRERTKHSASCPEDTGSDPALPPIPPRSTPNRPPQRFTLPTPSPPVPVPAGSSPTPSSRTPPPPDVPSRSQGPSLHTTPTLQTPPPITQTAVQPPGSPAPPPSPLPRPKTLALLPPLAPRRGAGGEGRRTSPASPATTPPLPRSCLSSSTASSASSSSSSTSTSPSSHYSLPPELKAEIVAPPLPPKASPAPAASQMSWPRERVQLSRFRRGHSPVHPRVASSDDPAPAALPRARTPKTPEDPSPRLPLDPQQPEVLTSAQPALPALPARDLWRPPSITASKQDSSDDSDYTEPFIPSSLLVNSPDKDMLLPVPRQKKRISSLCSDDELLDDDESNANHRDSWLDYEPVSTQGSLYLPSCGPLGLPPKEDSAHQSAVIKMGWLDKNPPQGALYYQRRWVKLDVDYLRYFDNEKEVYSKRMIATAAITKVMCVGELKFEVVTNNRTFLFRAENEVERNDWVADLLDCTRGRRRISTISTGSSVTTECYKGYLELRGLRSKLFTVVASDKVFLYKNIEDYHIGMGITSIDMNVGNVKDTDRRSFDLTTPYRIFCFTVESEQLKEQWVEAMRTAIGEALSNSEVAERIWAEPSNGCCADCGAAGPDWASINLCVVVCKRCAGEHRGLGPSISKIRSLKMDRKVWTEDLIQLFLLLGNERVNAFWAANVPPSEALAPSSCSRDRRSFIGNKYRQGKYRKYHPLYGNQRELDNALCINVQCSDVLETLSLVFCGADVNGPTGIADCPSTFSLATAHGQPLQAEFLSHNLNTELPRSEVGGAMETVHYAPSPSVSHNGFLYKTGSMARAIAEKKGRDEFSRRWCTLNDGCFSYYESDKNSSPNGTLKAAEIVCLAVSPPEKHGYDHTFELYSDSDRLYLFGTDDPESHREWVKSLAKTFIPANADPLLRLGFERIGRLKYKDGLNLQTPKVGWFALVGSTLYAYLDNSQGEEIHLRKLLELSIQQDNEVLVLVERGRTLYMEGERKLDFAGWCSAIQSAAGSGGDTLSQQQLTDTDIPVIVHSCIGYITQCGLTSEGIYRKSGVNSRVAALCDDFRRDARSICLREGVHQVDDVSNALKRFFRDVEAGLFTPEATAAWLSTVALPEHSQKIAQYQLLLSRLPCVNKATLTALVKHLYCVQRFSELNQMNLHNLAIVFGPTLFQTDGKDYTAGLVIEGLIEHYTRIFEVDEQQLKKQLDEITAIIKVRESCNTKVPTNGSGDFICTVYLEEKTETAEQHVKIPGSMTAAELTCEILDRRNIPIKEKDYWSCWEISVKEEIERPLHYQERVLAMLHSLGTDSYLLIKKHLAMEIMKVYLATKVDVAKNGLMKFREERSILGLGGFNERYFILNANTLRMYKEVRSNRPERDWSVKSLRIYLGIKKKVRPPSSWGLTMVYQSEKQEKPERQQWYLCCSSEAEMTEWFATFLSIQFDGDVWPEHGVQHRRSTRPPPPDIRHAF
ncbi:arf-GAP with Rho-GAP domain, ANK repeat and PH domain-containing protein 1 isoform X2 [Gadus morhua]|uniref:arf-GAP with Rho-GAP domain, ANK repeat and PH domain-containing protein 1 isoform X2 n=1 Tax=Gadus morhua TaxID=8049 RepID=UPI0011B65E83|nr:arf-GAP with Rho-GAP domain, ANK repeat and PH domain-containing protein 1 isoform X2 [Gadus morhua]